MKMIPSTNVLCLWILVAGMLLGCRPTDPTLMSPLGVGATAPEIAAKGWINGTPEATSGKVVVVDCWAYW